MKKEHRIYTLLVGDGDKRRPRRIIRHIGLDRHTGESLRHK